MTGGIPTCPEGTVATSGGYQLPTGWAAKDSFNILVDVGGVKTPSNGWQFIFGGPSDPSPRIVTVNLICIPSPDAAIYVP